MGTEPESDFVRIFGVGLQSSVFPSPLFEVVANKFETVLEVWDHSTGSGSWELNFARAFNDWEVYLVVNLLIILQKERITAEIDKVSWEGAAYAMFSMHSAYKVFTPRIEVLFPVKEIWVSSVPTKETFFLLGVRS